MKRNWENSDYFYLSFFLLLFWKEKSKSMIFFSLLMLLATVVMYKLSHMLEKWIFLEKSPKNTRPLNWMTEWLTDWLILAGAHTQKRFTVAILFLLRKCFFFLFNLTNFFFVLISRFVFVKLKWCIYSAEKLNIIYLWWVSVHARTSKTEFEKNVTEFNAVIHLKLLEMYKIHWVFFLSF